MTQAIALPGVHDGVQGVWSASPLADLAQFLAKRTFEPTKVQLCLEGDLSAAERAFGLTIPDRTTSGTFEPVQGYSMAYEWSSYDGRAVDVLRLNGPFDESKLTALLEVLVAQLNIVHRRDLEIILSATQS